MNEPILIKEKLGNINSFEIRDRMIDYLMLEWHEANKRILHKTTVSGTGIVMKFMKGNPQLTEGDVIYINERNIIVIDVIPCEAIVIHPKTMFEIASVCYEIGNKHLPLFYNEDALLVEYEEPLFQLLLSMGFKPKKDIRKLLHPLKTSVLPHISLSDSVFSNNMKLTISPK